MFPFSSVLSDPALDRRPRRLADPKAKEVGIEGRSKMSKDELIRALRNH